MVSLSAILWAPTAVGRACCILLLLFGGCVAIDEHVHEECIERWLTTKPELRERFSRDQVGWLCEHSEEWLKTALTPNAVPADATLTSKQRAWLTGIRSCQGDDCLADVRAQQCGAAGCATPPPSPPTERPRKVKPRPRIAVAPVRQAAPSATSSVELFASVDIKVFTKIVNEEVESAAACAFVHDMEILCPEVRNAESVATFLPANNITQREQFMMERKFRNLRTVCEDVSAVMSMFNDSTCNASVASRAKPKQALTSDDQGSRSKVTTSDSLCDKLKASQNAEELFPNLARRVADATNEDMKNTYRTWLQERYDKWKQRCDSRVDKTKSSVPVRAKRSERRLAFDSSDLRALRQEYRVMSDEARWRFQDALNELKHDEIDGVSKYDLLVLYHTPQESPGAHWGPAFLPFHREWIKQLEVALRQLDADVAVPYWDSTLDEGLPDARHSILWTDEFFGNGDGVVTTGPFGGWIAKQELSFVPGMKQLFRDVGGSPFGGLYKQDDFEFVMSRQIYEELTACVDPTFELIHGIVHMYVGGYMADIAISPNDPTFFMHHCFIDFMWEEWRQTKQTNEQRELDYPTDERSCNNFHFGSQPMTPFSLRNRDGLNNNYTKFLYHYYPKPQCSDTVPDCGSPYLYCNTRDYRCLSRLRPGGNCTGFEGTQICFDSVCNSRGLCEVMRSDTTTTTTTLPLTTTTEPTRSATTTTEPTTTTTQPRTTTTEPSTTTTTTQPRTTTTEPPSTTTTSTTTPIVSTTTLTDTTSTTSRPTTTTTTAAPTTTTTTTRPTTTTATTSTSTSTTTTTTTSTTAAPTTSTAPPTTWTTTWATTTTTRADTTQAEPGGDGDGADLPTVSFTLSIARGDPNDAASLQPVGAAVVRVVGRDVPTGYTQTTSGRLLADDVFPHYAHGAVARAMDPAGAGYFPLVEFALDVTSGGAACAAHCYSLRTRRYEPCADEPLRLSPNSQYTHPIAFRKTDQLVLNAMWAGRGHFKRRKTDYLFFVCP